MSTLDVVIIGGGPIGIACGLEAKKKRTTLCNPRERPHSKLLV